MIFLDPKKDADVGEDQNAPKFTKIFQLCVLFFPMVKLSHEIYLIYLFDQLTERQCANSTDYKCMLRTYKFKQTFDWND